MHRPAPRIPPPSPCVRQGCRTRHAGSVRSRFPVCIRPRDYFSRDRTTRDCQPGGLPESERSGDGRRQINRGWSERSEREPPDHVVKKTCAPAGAMETGWARHSTAPAGAGSSFFPAIRWCCRVLPHSPFGQPSAGYLAPLDSLRRVLRGCAAPPANFHQPSGLSASLPTRRTTLQ